MSLTDSISSPKIEVIDEENETDTPPDTHIDTLLSEPDSSHKPESDSDTKYAELLTKLSKMPAEEQQKFIANMQLLQQNAQKPKPKPESVLPPSKPIPAPKLAPSVASSLTREELLAKLHNRTSTLSLKRKPKKIVQEMATKMAAEPNSSSDSSANSLLNGSEMPNMAQLQEMMKKMNMKNMPAMPAMKDIEKMMKMLKKDGLN
jgi:hypothetical protein